MRDTAIYTTTLIRARNRQTGQLQVIEHECLALSQILVGDWHKILVDILEWAATIKVIDWLTQIDMMRQLLLADWRPNYLCDDAVIILQDAFDHDLLICICTYRNDEKGEKEHLLDVANAVVEIA